MVSGTTTIELQPRAPENAVLQHSKEQLPLHEPPKEDHRLSETQTHDPENAVEALPRWNYPRQNIWRLASIFFAFINFGMNDASLGPLLPYIQEDYSLNYTVASLVFLSPFVGYIVASLVADRLHLRFGKRGMAIFSPISRLLAYVVIDAHPPFPVIIVFLSFAGFGNGLLDGAWNTYLSEMDKANELLGLLHGCYGAGAVIAPSIATAMVVKYGLGWWQFFYIMTALMVVELVVCTAAFWEETSRVYKLKSRNDTDEKGMTRRAMKQKTTWVAAIFLFAYMGVEVSTGGYIVIFMTQVRHGQPFSSGLTATGFWLGFTVGRVVLGFVTPKIGERLAVVIYLIIAIGLELLFWLVPQFIISAVAIALVGFFIGPFFPAAVLMASRLLPKELHVAAVGFAAAFGGGGAALYVLPLVTPTQLYRLHSLELLTHVDFLSWSAQSSRDQV
ncbi:uncharacterized protein KY384_002368 [Bacidia gigantensis]|uniref:uncharacterized protein n=1 Tax=Bacidia gigantensis TaxID=2732470 RepID=UPI001D046FBA|nr:uncharacterized protein KY384_002368 [Bacidia gigantensis]KAG8532491.1 hypothetical protein KY384_002368 [Bacidia gigantensis]